MVCSTVSRSYSLNQTFTRQSSLIQEQNYGSQVASDEPLLCMPTMDSMFLLCSLVSAFTIFILDQNSQTMADCIMTDGNPDNAGSCTFENDVCGWSNADGNSLYWTRQQHSGSFMYVNMSDQTANSSAILQSPRVCLAPGSNASIRLRFSLGPCNVYGLSVYLQANSDTCLLWLGRNISGEITPPIVINSSVLNYTEFQIIIQGIKLDDSLCEQDGIYIDDIQLISPATEKFFEYTRAAKYVSVTPTYQATKDTACLNSLSCSFEESACGWNTAAGFGLQWTRKSHWFNDYMAMVMSDHTRMTSSRLESPWICPNGVDQYSLNFMFFYGNRENCQLSVLLITEQNTSRTVWTGKGNTGSTFHSLESKINLICPECDNSKFKIIFEGKKLKDGSCGEYDEIDVDDIEYKRIGLKTATTTPFSSSFIRSTDTSTATQNINSTTANSAQPINLSATFLGSSLTSRHSQHEHISVVTLTYSSDFNQLHNLGMTNIVSMTGNTDSTHTNKESNQHIPSGVVAAVVSTAIVAIIIVTVIAIILRQKREKKDDLFPGEVLQQSESMAPFLLRSGDPEIIIENTIYSSDDAHVTGSLIKNNHENFLSNGDSPNANLNPLPSEYYATVCPGDLTTSDDADMRNINNENEENIYNKVVLDTSCDLHLSANTYDHIGH